MQNAVTPGATETLAQNLIDSPTTKPSRRTFLSSAAFAAAGLAVLSAGDGLAAESNADPIFAAIERHRAAYAAYDATLGEDHLEAYIPYEQRQSSCSAAIRDEPDWRVPTDHPDWIAHIEWSAVTFIEEAEAACLLVSTEGLTPGGAVALLNYAKERSTDREFWQDLDQDGKRHSWHYLMLCQVTEALAVQA